MDAVTPDIQSRVKRVRRFLLFHVPIREHRCSCRGRQVPRALATLLQSARICEKVQGFWRWRCERNMPVHHLGMARPWRPTALVPSSAAATAKNVVHELFDRGKGGGGLLVDSENDHVAAEIRGCSVTSGQPHVRHGVGAHWLTQAHGTKQCVMVAHVPDRRERGRAKSLSWRQPPSTARIASD
jgi:hypothetical protein